MRALFLAALLPLSAQAEGWDIQFAPPFDLSGKRAFYDLDLENHAPAEIAALTAAGAEVACYVSVGTLESYRPDVPDFPPELVGKVWPDWPDERYLDIRDRARLLPLMRARFKACAEAGFTAIEADNQDLHFAPSGFPVSREDQVEWSRLLAAEAHALGLKFGHKNSPDLVPDLVSEADFAVTESCFLIEDCPAFAPFVAAGKPVWNIEYTDTPVDFDAACAASKKAGITTILKDRALTGGSYRACD